MCGFFFAGIFLGMVPGSSTLPTSQPTVDVAVTITIPVTRTPISIDTSTMTLATSPWMERKSEKPSCDIDTHCTA